MCHVGDDGLDPQNVPGVDSWKNLRTHMKPRRSRWPRPGVPWPLPRCPTRVTVSRHHDESSRVGSKCRPRVQPLLGGWDSCDSLHSTYPITRSRSRSYTEGNVPTRIFPWTPDRRSTQETDYLGCRVLWIVSFTPGTRSPTSLEKVPRPLLYHSPSRKRGRIWCFLTTFTRLYVSSTYQLILG